MRTLIVGIGALGGTIATRALAARMPVWLATRTAEAANALRSSGLRVGGVGGSATGAFVPARALDQYPPTEPFELILLATKAHDALEIATHLPRLLTRTGTILPIQNGGVGQILADRLGAGVVLGGLSNLGATLVEPGVYEQRNAGHLLIGETGGGRSERAAKIAEALNGAIETRVTENLQAVVWAKLLLNCAITTIGALAGRTMRHYIATPAGREIFRSAYQEALAVALASGVRPERMIVDAVPPAWEGSPYDAWIAEVLAAYGDLKPSMLQDFERGRRTEIDFINGYVAQLGNRLGVPVPANAAIAALAHRIERAEIRPDPARLHELWEKVSRPASRRSPGL